MADWKTLGNQWSNAHAFRDELNHPLVFTKTDDEPTSITRAQVKTIVTTKARTYARGTISYMVDVLRSCLQAAVEDGIIPVNPASRLGALAVKGKKATPVEMLAP